MNTSSANAGSPDRIPSGNPGIRNVGFSEAFWRTNRLIVCLALMVITLLALLAFMFMAPVSKYGPEEPGNQYLKKTQLSDYSMTQGIGAKKLIEESLERRSMEILDRIFGSGRSLVTVNADIDMEVIKRVHGEGDFSGLSMEGLGKVPGTVTEYVQAPGEIKRLSVSVIIDGQYKKDKTGKQVFIPLPENEIRNVENVLKQALGFDETRDDTIAVTCMPLAGTTIKSGPWRFLRKIGGMENPWAAWPLLFMLITGIAILSFEIFRRARGRADTKPAEEIPAIRIEPAIKSASEEVPVEKPSITPHHEITTAKVPVGPFASLNQVDTSILRDYLKGEHPQTIAVVLAHLESRKSARIIMNLPEAIQGEVVYRMASLGVIPRVVIDELDQVLKRDIEAMGAFDGSKPGGITSVADIMNHLDINTENVIFASLEDADPLLADRIRQQMFVFEDILNIDNRGIQTLLKEITNEDLMVALKPASPELKEKIFSNMSGRASQMLKEDMEALGLVKVADVEISQQSIIRVARKLERLGRLVIAGKGRENVLV